MRGLPGGGFSGNVRTSGAFWEGAEMTERDQLVRGLLSYHHPPTEEQSHDFPVTALQLLYVASRKSV